MICRKTSEIECVEDCGIHTRAWVEHKYILYGFLVQVSSFTLQSNNCELRTHKKKNTHTHTKYGQEFMQKQEQELTLYTGAQISRVLTAEDYHLSCAVLKLKQNSIVSACQIHPLQFYTYHCTPIVLCVCMYGEPRQVTWSY